MHNIIKTLLLNILIKENEVEYKNNRFYNWKRTSIKSIMTETNIVIIDKYFNKDINHISDFYQSLLSKNIRLKTGIFYTPIEIVKDVYKDIKINGNVLDPSCGCGNFLLNLPGNILLKNIYGFDIDSNAILITKILLLLKYKNQNIIPNIFHKDFLNSIIKFDIDFIIGNPPWGFNNQSNRLKSTELFTQFILKSLDILKDNSVLSFILPEAILNIKKHKNIRNYIINNFTIQNIKRYNQKIKEVMSPLIRLDIIKKIYNNKVRNNIFQDRYKSNIDNIFDINVNKKDIKLLNKIYRKQHTSLKINTDWALGIVSGNNNKYIINKQIKDTEIIYTGKDIKPFILENSNKYIKFKNNSFQQVAPEYKYRNNKIIYKFISKKLILVYDNKKSLILNSLNSFNSKSYNMKIICCLFNSKLYQYIYSKKFNTIKVLRGNLEDLPLPILDNTEKEFLLKYWNCQEKTENFIFKLFNIDKKEIKIVLDK